MSSAAGSSLRRRLFPYSFLTSGPLRQTKQDGGGPSSGPLVQTKQEGEPANITNERVIDADHAVEAAPRSFVQTLQRKPKLARCRRGGRDGGGDGGGDGGDDADRAGGTQGHRAALRVASGGGGGGGGEAQETEEETEDETQIQAVNPKMTLHISISPHR